MPTVYNRIPEYPVPVEGLYNQDVSVLLALVDLEIERDGVGLSQLKSIRRILEQSLKDGKEMS